MNKLYSFKKEILSLKEIMKKMDEAEDRLSKVSNEAKNPKNCKGVRGLKTILKFSFELIRFKLVCSRLMRQSNAILGGKK